MIALPTPLWAISGLEYGLRQASGPALVICFLLLALSIFCWSVMWAKHKLLKQAHAANVEFLHVFRHSNHPLSIFQSRERFELSPCYHIYHFAAQELAFHLVGVDQPDRIFVTRMQAAGRISPTQMEAVQRIMERAAAEAAVKLETRLPTVSLLLSAAPFLGLLGTVWGVMDSFAATATGSAGPAAMAPGICAALLTTVVGLLVTLPSMLAYNLLVSRIRTMVVRLETCMGELSGAFDRQYVDHSGTHAPVVPAVLGLEPTFSSTLNAPTGSVPAEGSYEQHPMSSAPVIK